MSLNFKRLQRDHVLQIRKRFASEGYKEGLVTKEVENSKKKGFLGMFKSKPIIQPVLTIRDYFCFLNLIQSYSIRSHCANCNQETDTRLSKLLHRAPEILIVGFTEAEEPEAAGLDAAFDFKIDTEFDISPFVNQVQNKYELLTVVTKEADALGIENDVIYMRGNQNDWLRVDLHSIIPIDPNFLQELVSPSILIYQKKLSPDTERKNLESNFTLRDQIAGVELAPLPCFYMEELKLLGIKPEIALGAYLCQHKRLMPTYREIFPQKSSSDLLYEWEANFIQNKRGIKPERLLCATASASIRRLLVGTTLLQKPIVEYVLEKVISFEWGSSWYFYLFYDTELFQQSAISTNFPLPVPPGPLTQTPNGTVITLNYQLMEIIRHLYLEVPWSQKALETINKRDITMADKAIEGTLSEDEYEIILLRVRKLVSVRIQKIELENFVDYWVGEGINPESVPHIMTRSPDGGLDVRRVPNKGSSGTLGSGGTNSNEYAQEYFDSDSDKEDREYQDGPEPVGRIVVKKTLSQIDEERTEMMKDDQTMGDPTPVSPMKALHFGQTQNFSKALKSVGMPSPSQRVGTGGCDRTQTEYITTESAMKAYIQKNLMLKDFRTRKPQSASNVEALGNNPLSPVSLGVLAPGDSPFDKSNSARMVERENLQNKSPRRTPSPGKAHSSASKIPHIPSEDIQSSNRELHHSSRTTATSKQGTEEVAEVASQLSDPGKQLDPPKDPSRGRLNSSKFFSKPIPIAEEKLEHAADSEDPTDEPKVQEAPPGRNSSSEEFDEVDPRQNTPAGSPVQKR